MLPNRVEILRKVRALPSAPMAIEAYWDGDTSGWFVVLTALLHGEDGRIAEQEIATLSGGGDLRIFNGQVPPWPEADLARTVGQEIADSLGLPFWFPSPNHPEEDCPRFCEREQAVPCTRCGIPLLQKDTCPWKGLCYECHLALQRGPDVR